MNFLELQRERISFFVRLWSYWLLLNFVELGKAELLTFSNRPFNDRLVLIALQIAHLMLMQKVDCDALCFLVSYPLTYPFSLPQLVRCFDGFIQSVQRYCLNFKAIYDEQLVISPLC